MTESRKAEFYQETKEYYMSHIPEDKQRQYEKIFIEMDAIKRIIRKEYKYISYATDVEGLRIDIDAVKRTLAN
jgi:Iap family predicted aminopeptidase